MLGRGRTCWSCSRSLLAWKKTERMEEGEVLAAALCTHTAPVVREHRCRMNRVSLLLRVQFQVGHSQRVQFLAQRHELVLALFPRLHAFDAV